MSLGNRAKTIFDVGSTLVVTAAAGALLWTLYKSDSPRMQRRLVSKRSAA